MLSKRRRKRGRPMSKSCPPVLSTPIKKTRKQWSDESMLAAIEAVKNGETLLRAAVTFGVPRTTLGDRIRGKVVHGTKCGPRPYLSPEEELQLSEFIVEVSQTGYGKPRREIITLAENVVYDKGMLRGGRVTSGWFRRFMERHPDLSIRKGDVTELIKKQKEEEKAKKKQLRETPEQRSELPDQPTNLMWTVANDLQIHLHQGLLQEPNVRNL